MSNSHLSGVFSSIESAAHEANAATQANPGDADAKAYSRVLTAMRERLGDIPATLAAIGHIRVDCPSTTPPPENIGGQVPTECAEGNAEAEKPANVEQIEDASDLTTNCDDDPIVPPAPDPSSSQGIDITSLSNAVSPIVAPNVQHPAVVVPATLTVPITASGAPASTSAPEPAPIPAPAPAPIPAATDGIESPDPLSGGEDKVNAPSNPPQPNHGGKPPRGASESAIRRAAVRVKRGTTSTRTSNPNTSQKKRAREPSDNEDEEPAAKRPYYSTGKAPSLLNPPRPLFRDDAFIATCGPLPGSSSRPLQREDAFLGPREWSIRMAAQIVCCHRSAPAPDLSNGAASGSSSSGRQQQQTQPRRVHPQRIQPQQIQPSPFNATNPRPSHATQPAQVSPPGRAPSPAMPGWLTPPFAGGQKRGRGAEDDGDEEDTPPTKKRTPSPAPPPTITTLPSMRTRHPQEHSSRRSLSVEEEAAENSTTDSGSPLRRSRRKLKKDHSPPKSNMRSK